MFCFLHFHMYCYQHFLLPPNLSIFLFIYLSSYVSMYLSIYLSMYLSPQMSSAKRGTMQIMRIIIKISKNHNLKLLFKLINWSHKLWLYIHLTTSLSIYLSVYLSINSSSNRQHLSMNRAIHYYSIAVT